MLCIYTSKIVILINGDPTEIISPSIGIRQRDPLSSYILILYVDVLFSMINRAQLISDINGISLAKNAPQTTHLLFIDDNLIFYMAKEKDILNLVNILNIYQEASGQKINYSKSEMVFNSFVQENTKNDIQSYIDIPITDRINNYLGLPTHIWTSKGHTMTFIIDKIKKIMQGWKSKNLS